MQRRQVIGVRPRSEEKEEVGIAGHNGRLIEFYVSRGLLRGEVRRVYPAVVSSASALTFRLLPLRLNCLVLNAIRPCAALHNPAHAVLRYVVYLFLA